MYVSDDKDSYYEFRQQVYDYSKSSKVNVMVFDDLDDSGAYMNDYNIDNVEFNIIPYSINNEMKIN